MAQARSRTGRVTVRDVAEAAGVSVASVSRALSDDPTIAGKTRDKVLEAADRLGYVPNMFARGLVSRQNGIVALFADNITNPFYPEVVVRLTARLQTIGLSPMLMSLDDGGSGARRALRRINPDVAVFLTATATSDMLGRLEDEDIPFILFNRYVEGIRASVVACDNRAGGREVALALARAGHQHPAFLGGLPGASTNSDRLQGFLDGCAEAGLAAPLVIPGGSFTYETGYDGLRAVFADAPATDAVFCGNDIIAIGAMNAARQELGLAVGRDLSIVGFDDIAMAAWPEHDLATVRQPMVAMLDRLVAEIERVRSGQDVDPARFFLPGRLIVRGSARLETGDVT
jgi:DNA-binding LacI/PurR family transcriptional regulator